MLVARDPESILAWLQANHPTVYDLLLLTDEFWSGVIFQDDAPHTISWHIACMCQRGDPIAKLAYNALNALSPNHCAGAIAAEGPCQ